jgi:hypothetical protein
MSKDATFFSAVDYTMDKNTGVKKIGSEYPAWFHAKNIEDLQETIHTDRRRLKAGNVPPNELEVVRARVKKEEDRLCEILESKPILSDAEKDDLDKGLQTLGGYISYAEPTREEIKRGTVDSRQQANIMTLPCIELKDKKLIDLAKACNVPVTKKGEVTRTGATKMMHIGKAALGERFFLENLRRD